MNQPLKNQDIKLPIGSTITGKWHHHSYQIIQKLGAGACGTVYLAKLAGKDVAIKLSENSSSVATEVNVLKSFQKVQGASLGPSLLDVDDWVKSDGSKISFYAMEYLKGNELTVFLKKHGEEWLGILMIQLLDNLEKLHQSGWVFGDLKPENLIVTHPPARLRWIDVGGTTQIGRSIKEFTEFYDRGYWGLGSRKAEPSYDLFALAMVMIQIYHPKRFERGQDGEKTLFNKLNQTTSLKRFYPSLKKALTGQYTSSLEMRRDLTEILMDRPEQRRKQSMPSRKQTAVNKKKRQKQAPKNSRILLEGFGIFIAVLAFYFLYLIFQVL